VRVKCHRIPLYLIIIGECTALIPGCCTLETPLDATSHGVPIRRPPSHTQPPTLNTLSPRLYRISRGILCESEGRLIDRRRQPSPSEWSIASAQCSTTFEHPDTGTVADRSSNPLPFFISCFICDRHLGPLPSDGHLAPMPVN
jgi:hypothetical protein